MQKKPKPRIEMIPRATTTPVTATPFFVCIQFGADCGAEDEVVARALVVVVNVVGLAGRLGGLVEVILEGEDAV